MPVTYTYPPLYLDCGAKTPGLSHVDEAPRASRRTQLTACMVGTPSIPQGLRIFTLVAAAVGRDMTV
jgi:hypothetical protein